MNDREHIERIAADARTQKPDEAARRRLRLLLEAAALRDADDDPRTDNPQVHPESAA